MTTFYSYKGGTGRTMALANVACLLASRQPPESRVLAIDWDLEAPGLHRYFESLLPGPTGVEGLHPGLIDLFEDLEAALRRVAPSSDRGAEAAVDAVVGSFPVTRYVQATSLPGLQFLSAGRLDRAYASRVNQFDWEGLFQRAPRLFQALASRLAREYCHVLIDARTGLSDISGVSTTLMPERLVVVFTPNKQSMSGAAEIVRQAVEYRRTSSDLRPLLVYPLPSRIEAERETLRRAWREGDPAGGLSGYQPLFEDLFRELYSLPECTMGAYFSEVQVQHSPDMAYGEQIVVLNPGPSDRFSLKRSYEAFLQWLEEGVAPWVNPSEALRARQAALALSELDEAADRIRKRIDEDEPSGIEDQLRDVLGRSEQLRGAQHPATLELANALGRVLARRGDLEGAAATLAHVASSRRNLGDELGALASLNSLARVRWSQGRRPEATKMWQDVLAGSARLLGAGHPDTITAANNLGAALAAHGNHILAVQTLEAGLAASRAAYGEEHPHTVTTLGNLAHACLRAGHLARARVLAEQVVAVLGRTHGPHHAQLISAKQFLSEVLEAGELGGGTASGPPSQRP